MNPTAITEGALHLSCIERLWQDEDHSTSQSLVAEKFGLPSASDESPKLTCAPGTVELDFFWSGSSQSSKRCHSCASVTLTMNNKFSAFLLLCTLPIWLASCASVVKISETKAGGTTGTLESQVAAIESAWRKLERLPTSAEAQSEYNASVDQIFTTLRNAKLKPWAAPIKVGAFTLAWQPHARPVWAPAQYDLIPTSQMKIAGSYVDQRVIKPGLGAPLVARRSADQVHEYAPTPHFHFAATGVARFEGKRCVLALEDPMEAEKVRLGSRSYPLAADLTAPAAMMLAEMEKEKLGLPRLLHPAKYAATARVSRLEPYDPNKTVVLLVHGLMSSPATWFPMMNHLQSNAEVRRKYQFWFFSYPSGYPYAYSAAIMRRELDKAEKHYPLHKKMIVIGHSMGGCISRLLITDSGPRIWNELFEVSPEKIDLSPEHKHILTESTIFQHRPEIGRVIFISAPLRGADLASGWLGRVGARLVSLPGNMLNVGKDILSFRKPAAGHQHLKRIPTSVDSLSEKNDFVLAVQKVPLTPGIPHHTIAGDRGKGDAPNSSDGLVPYWSSHLTSAASEKIVPSHHPAHQHPQCMDEVLRILMLHDRLDTATLSRFRAR